MSETVSIKNPGALALYLAKHISTTPVNDVGCIAIDTLTPEEWAVIINALKGNHDG